MKKNLRSCLAALLVVSVFGFMGCEAGLTSNDGNGSPDDSGDSGFSFSDLYSRIKILEKENKKLNEVIEQLTDQQANTSSGLAGRIDALEGHVGGISVADLKNTIDDLSYSVSDSWSGAISTTSLSYQYISGAPEIVLTDVKAGDIFIASLDVTGSTGYSTLIATSGLIEWCGSAPTIFFDFIFYLPVTTQHGKAMGIFKAASSGTIIIRMHSKGYKKQITDIMNDNKRWVDMPANASQGSVLVSKLGKQ
ncbi:MAG: hypothetical protein GY754_23720 [bacterium]|nr:hypothetical protein [bacterium]